MLKQIIKEELGISNDVNNLVLRIKNLISSKFSKKYIHNVYYREIKGFEVFCDSFYIDYDGSELNIIFIVLKDEDSATKNLFHNTLTSETSLDNSIIRLFLTKTGNKIDWNYHSSTLQHEVEHFFQSKKKNGPFLNKKDFESYKKNIKLIKSDNIYEKIIGYIFYFYIKYEKNAFVNGLYRQIMDESSEYYIPKPIEVLKEYGPYITLNTIKRLINEWNENDIEKVTLILKSIGKTYESFLKISNNVFKMYAKSFGKVIYKAEKDLKEKYGEYMI